LFIERKLANNADKTALSVCNSYWRCLAGYRDWPMDMAWYPVFAKSFSSAFVSSDRGSAPFVAIIDPYAVNAAYC
jgi:hypothetical protein